MEEFFSNERGPIKPIYIVPRYLQINVANDRVTTYLNGRMINKGYRFEGIKYKNYSDYAAAVADFYGLKSGDVKRRTIN